MALWLLAVEIQRLSRHRPAGAQAILTKPTRSMHLRKTIDEVIAVARRARRTGGEHPVPEAEKAPHPAAMGTDAVLPPAAAAEAAPGEALDVLVAEDNEVNRLVLRQILDGTGRSYAVAENGRAALALWRTRRPALILMDVSMLRMNGLEATAAIRQAEAEEGLCRTPIVGLTAHALEGDRERCLEVGMDDHMTKPVSPTRPEAKVTAWLSGAMAGTALVAG